MIASRSLLGKKALAVLFSDSPLSDDLLAQWETLAVRHPGELALILVGPLPAAAQTWPFIATDDADGALARAFGAETRPVAYFIRGDGLVTRVAHGDDPLLTDAATFTRLVRALIG